MTTTAEKIWMPDLHRYLDGELPPEQVVALVTRLEAEPAGIDRLHDYGVQGDLIRRLYGPLLNRPLPTELLAINATAAAGATPALPARLLSLLVAMAVLAAGAIGLMQWSELTAWLS